MRKIFSCLILANFIFSCLMPPPGFAQSFSAVGLMPAPGVMVGLSPAYIPAYLSGMVVHPNDPFKYDFIVHRGSERMTEARKQAEYLKIIKYFLASLAVPDNDQWVNLSPYEKDRIIPDNYGLTEMGRDVLAQDYMLKQISASLTNPDTDLGKKFWDAVYAKSYEKFGTTDIPTETFNKVWIMPGKAVMFEKGDTVVVLEHHLKVMLNSDYVAMSHQKDMVESPAPAGERAIKENGVDAAEAGSDTEASRLSEDVMREVIIPVIEKEVNEGKNFAPLRQIHSSMLLAAWYKRALKESILNKIYGDKDKVKGVDQDPKANQEIYEKYTAAFKKGVFDMIREDVGRFSREIMPRRYFSGGAIGEGANFSERVVMAPDSAETVDAVATEVAENSDGVRIVFIPAKAGPVNQEEKPLPLAMNEQENQLWRDLTFALDQEIPATYKKDEKTNKERLVAGMPGRLLMLPEAKDGLLRVLLEMIEELFVSGFSEVDIGSRLEAIITERYSDNKYRVYTDILRKFIPGMAARVVQDVRENNSAIKRDVVEKMIYSLMDSSINVAALMDGTRIPVELARDVKMFLWELPGKILVVQSQSEGMKKEKAEQMVMDSFLRSMEEKYPTLNKQGYRHGAAVLARMAIKEGRREPGFKDEEGGQSAGAVVADASNGGVDFTPSNLDMQIRRDGAGVPLPVSQQDLDSIHIEGLVPEILSIQPASGMPLFRETDAASPRI